MLEGYKGLSVNFNSAVKLSLESFGQMFLFIHGTLIKKSCPQVTACLMEDVFVLVTTYFCTRK